MNKVYGIMMLVIFLLASCNREAEPLSYGKDSCEHCKMTIMDNKYGAEVVTVKGKVFKFDAAECMVDYLKADPQKLNNPKDLFLTVNVAAPGDLTDARTAFFLNDKAFKSPMGANIASFTSRQLAEINLQSADGVIYTWDEFLQTR